MPQQENTAHTPAANAHSSTWIKDALLQFPCRGRGGRAAPSPSPSPSHPHTLTPFCKTKPRKSPDSNSQLPHQQDTEDARSNHYTRGVGDGFYALKTQKSFGVPTRKAPTETYPRLSHSKLLNSTWYNNVPLDMPATRKTHRIFGAWPLSWMSQCKYCSFN